MDKRKIRDTLRFISSLLFSWLYIPHIIIGGRNRSIISDIERIKNQININLPRVFQLIYLLHNNRYFRTLFYHRIGPIWSALIQWYRPGDRYFIISATTKIGESMWIAHPYATIINAESIGSNFSCIHCTTLGATSKGRPTLGNNVSLGANVTIIGNVHIGNNVTIGAGSVVVKDLPDNCVAVGNPARVIRFIE
jgi:serine acetyltransferase